MQASIATASFALMGSSLNQGPVRADGAEGTHRPKQLKGKRVAVGQIGDAPYNYTVASARRPASASATCSGFRSAPTSPAAPRRSRPTAPTRRC